MKGSITNVIIDVYACGNVQTPSSRLRWANYKEKFDSRGHDFSFNVAKDFVYKRVVQTRPIRKADAIILQKVVFAPWILKAFRKKANSFLLDLDDAIWLPHSSRISNMVGSKKKLLNKWMDDSFPMFDNIIVSNEFLADYVRDFNKAIHVVPTSPSDKVVCKHEFATQSSDLFTLGWTGTKGNIFYLHSIEPALNRFFSDFPNSQLIVISDGKYKSEFPLVEKRTVNIPWTVENEQKYLRFFDVGLMPLTTDCWAMGKAAFKLILYFKHSVASIASGFGYQTEFVVDGENALLAVDNDQWYESLRKLVEEPSLRKKLATAGFQVYEKSFSEDVIFSKYLTVLEKWQFS